MSHGCRALKCLYSSNHRGRRQAPFFCDFGGDTQPSGHVVLEIRCTDLNFSPLIL